MRQTNVCSNRVFVPGVHASPRRSEKKEEEDTCLRIISLKGSTLQGAIRETAGWILVNFGL